MGAWQVASVLQVNVTLAMSALTALDNGAHGGGALTNAVLAQEVSSQISSAIQVVGGYSTSQVGVLSLMCTD